MKKERRREGYEREKRHLCGANIGAGILSRRHLTSECTPCVPNPYMSIAQTQNSNTRLFILLLLFELHNIQKTNEQTAVFVVL